MRMRITVATGPLLPVPALLGGAIPRMWDGLAREFARRGHEVNVFARGFPGQADGETAGGVRYLRWGGFSQGRSIALDLARGFAYGLRAVWRLPQAEILVTNDFWLPIFAAALRPGAGRVVINANRFPKGQYFLYRSAGRIAAASSAVRDAILEQAPALGERVRVLPNAIDTGIMAPGESARSVDPRVLLFAGRVHPEKGVHVLARAFAGIANRHPGWLLRILGPWRVEEGGGGEAYVAQLKRVLEGVPAEIAEPQFDSTELAKEYRSASLFCYPSLAEKGESFGVAPLEAMACGVPPVVSALACFRDFVNDGATGWIFDHRVADPAASLAAVLECALADPARLAHAGQLGSEQAKRFGYAEVAGRYLEEFGILLREDATHA